MRLGFLCKNIISIQPEPLSILKTWWVIAVSSLFKQELERTGFIEIIHIEMGKAEIQYEFTSNQY